MDLERRIEALKQAHRTYGEQFLKQFPREDIQLLLSAKQFELSDLSRSLSDGQGINPAHKSELERQIGEFHRALDGPDMDR